MSPSTSDATKASHVLAIPYPGRGHINPLLNLCKSLTLQNPEIHLDFTFIITEEWLSFIGSEPKPSNLEYATIPNVIPSELVRGSDMKSFLHAVTTKMEGPVEEVVDRIEETKGKVRLIVSDSYLYWAVSIGNRRRIPVASFWPMSASVFCMFYHYQAFIDNGCYPIDLSAGRSGDDRIDFIPGLSSMRLADVPDVFSPGLEHVLDMNRRLMSAINNAQYLLFRSIYELEATPIDILKSKLSLPIYPIGPAIPYFNLKQNPSLTSTKPNYLKWLDSQPQNSVLYISLGSFCPVSSQQMEEIAAALRDSGVGYLWVARGEASKWENDSNGGKGFVVSWCDQLRVLSHSSVGGFLTHCGWNSTLETVFMGVPVLTFPILMDQPPNSKLMVEDWEIGWRVKTRKGNRHLVTREEISCAVKRFMDLGCKEREKLDINVRKFQEKARSGVAKGGSSEINLAAFSKSILEL